MVLFRSSEQATEGEKEREALSVLVILSMKVHISRGKYGDICLGTMYSGSTSTQMTIVLSSIYT